MRRRVHTGFIKRAAALVLCCAMAMLSACGKEPETAQLQEGEELTIAVTELPDTLNPLYASSRLAEEFFLLVYDPLWRIDANGEPVACLAEDYSLSSDQLTWTIRLRRDATFSDGVPVTSADVKYTFETMMINSQIYDPCFDGVSTIRCPDDYTVVITTDYVKGDMRLNPVPILPMHIWSDQSDLRSFENDQLIGSGPFVCQMVDTGPQETSWTFQARSNYFGGAAQVGSVKFIYYSTETFAARALSSGEVDGAFGLSDVQLTTLQGVPGVRLIQSYLPSSEIWGVAFNTRRQYFANAPMRLMVEYCTDRAWMLSMSSGEAGMTGSVWAAPGTSYFNGTVNLRGMSAADAQNICYTAGYYDQDQNGMLENIVTGDPLVLNLYTSSQDSWSSTAATILIDGLKAIGVDVKLKVVDGPVTGSCTPKGDWDMCMLSWRGNANPVLAAQRFCAAQNSLTGWSSDAYQAAYEQLCTATDPIAVQNAAYQLQQIVYDECPYLVLIYHSDIQAVRDDGWTGFEDVLTAAGGVFGIGSVDAYMKIAPAAPDAAEEQ